VIEKRQRQTCENIINKMNMKNFGLNYEPLIEQCAQKYGLEKGNVLVVCVIIFSTNSLFYIIFIFRLDMMFPILHQ
jgi:hypothetical protein